jgi:hypothetical protein
VVQDQRGDLARAQGWFGWGCGRGGCGGGWGRRRCR